HGALIVLGGSNFEKPPYDGGVKQWLDTIFVLEPGASRWQTFRSAGPIAYGGSVTWRDSFVIAGGTDGRTHFRDVRRIEWIDRKPVVTPLPAMPLALANCEATLVGDRIFVFGGQESPAATSASAALLSLDLSNPKSGWQRRDALPGPGRILPVFAAAGADLYVFGGAELTPAGRRYLQDGWRWRPSDGWSPSTAPPFAMVAAPAAAISPESILVFGGDDGANATRIEELRERHPGFSKELFEFRVGERTWVRRGAIPTGLVTTAAVPWQSRVVIPGGEDRPGHRSARVLSWLPE
ncbi:MAG: Kelch repeat-containing protein, partial [Bryobacterales bacterium]|nr:Kelch repeat-containing protein [Bryobacterales bacterium]